MADTIFALATAPGRAAVAVLRLSGPGVGEALRALAGRLPPPREARLRRLRGSGGEALDKAIVLWLPEPASYTGEDGAELHLHGGSAIVDAVSGALLALGLRLAEPGEFTRRAFEHGRMDLDQAEAVADLVDAETDGQRRQALAQLDGALGRRYGAWRSEILEALTVLEAAIDFPDEDVPADIAGRARPHLQRLERELTGALLDSDRGQKVREGFRVALIGAPNAGKSSLLNRLLARDAAIVTAIAGTTRDVIEAPLVLGGFKVLLADMAGMRDVVEEIEAEGVRRARAWAESADRRLWVVDGSVSSGAWLQAAELTRPGDRLILNKTDLAEGEDGRAAQALAQARGLQTARTSATHGEGIEAVLTGLTTDVTAALSGGEFPSVTRARHRARLQEALDHVRRGIGAMDSGAELAAEDLRLAGRSLARVSGRIDAEEVLERIFASFCIGK